MKAHRRGQGQDFLVKMSGFNAMSKHCFSLVCMYGFGGNNALYSASSSYSLDKADFRVPAPKR